MLPDLQTTAEAGVPGYELDAWFGFQPREILDGHIARAGLHALAEVWCHAPADLVGARYAARVAARPAGHLGLDYVPELIALARDAAPLGGFPLYRVDTFGDLPLAALVAWAREFASGA